MQFGLIQVHAAFRNHHGIIFRMLWLAEVFVFRERTFGGIENNDRIINRIVKIPVSLIAS